MLTLVSQEPAVTRSYFGKWKDTFSAYIVVVYQPSFQFSSSEVTGPNFVSYEFFESVTKLYQGSSILFQNHRSVYGGEFTVMNSVTSY